MSELHCSSPWQVMYRGVKVQKAPSLTGHHRTYPFPILAHWHGESVEFSPFISTDRTDFGAATGAAPAQKMLQNYQQWQHHEQCYWVWIGVHGPTWVRCHVAMCQALAASLRSRRVVDAVPHGNLDLVTVAKRVPKEASTSPQRSLSLTFSLFIRVTKLILAPPPWPHLPLGKRAARMADLLNSDLRESIPSFSSPLPARKICP